MRPLNLPVGVRAILPIAATVPLFAISFGVLARASGMGIAAPIVMSATTFGGSAQFAVASILDEGGSVRRSRVDDVAGEVHDRAKRPSGT